MVSKDSTIILLASNAKLALIPHKTLKLCLDVIDGVRPTSIIVVLRGVVGCRGSSPKVSEDSTFCMHDRLAKATDEHLHATVKIGDKAEWVLQSETEDKVESTPSSGGRYDQP